MFKLILFPLIVVGAVAFRCFQSGNNCGGTKSFVLFSTEKKSKAAVPECYLQVTDPFFHTLPEKEKNKICTNVCPAPNEMEKEEMEKVRDQISPYFHSYCY